MVNMDTLKNGTVMAQSTNTNQTRFNNLVPSYLSGFNGPTQKEKNDQFQRQISEGQVLYDFGWGVSPFLPETSILNGLCDSKHYTAYAPLAGIPELQKAICKFHIDYDDLEFEPNQVIVGPGSSHLIFVLFEAFKGDIILVSPTWPTYIPQASLTHHQIYIIKTSIENDWRVQPEQIEKVIKDNNLKGNKLLVLVNPDNPTGTCYGRDQLEAIRDVCRSNNVIVLCDEIYARFCYDQKHDSLARYYPEGTIVSSGFSKWAAIAGWRVGYHIFPPALEQLKKAVTLLAANSFSCINIPAQYALVKALKNERAIKCYIQHTSRILAAVGAYCYRELTSVGLRCMKPKAGFYIFVNFDVIKEALKKRGLETTEQLREALVHEASVILIGGHPSLRHHDILTLRVAFVNFNGKLVLEESQRIGLDHNLDDDFVKRCCEPLCNGIQAIKMWVNKQLQIYA